MASTYSPNLRLELIGTGDQQGTWGITTNTNLGTLLEQAIGGYETVTVSDVGDTTLTASNGSADQSRNMVLNLSGTISAARNVVCPAIEKLYVVKNATTGGFAVTFKVSGQTGVSVPNGSTYFLYVDGTDARLITGTIASQNSNNVSITGGSISGATVSNTSLSNVSVVANASSLSVRDADASHILSIAVGSNLTANTIFTLTTGAASNRTLDISASNVTISTAGAALIDDADASAQRATLGLGAVALLSSVSLTSNVSGTLPVANGGTGVTASTGTGNNVLSASPALTGDPTAPTQAFTDDDTSIATTAFAQEMRRQIVRNAQTGTTFTPSASDAGKAVTLTNASAITVTIDNSVFTAEDRVDFIQGGAGQVTFAAGAGFTLRSSGSKLKLTGQWSGATIYFLSASEGVLIGDIAT